MFALFLLQRLLNRPVSFLTGDNVCVLLLRLYIRLLLNPTAWYCQMGIRSSSHHFHHNFCLVFMVQFLFSLLGKYSKKRRFWYSGRMLFLNYLKLNHFDFNKTIMLSTKGLKYDLKKRPSVLCMYMHYKKMLHLVYCVSQTFKYHTLT